MSEAPQTERDKIIEACMRACLSVRATSREDREIVEIITGAACYRMMQLMDRKQSPLHEASK
jgi:hypothetical protein